MHLSFKESSFVKSKTKDRIGLSKYRTDSRYQRLKVTVKGYRHNLFYPVLYLLLVFLLSFTSELIYYFKQNKEAKVVSNLVDLYLTSADMANTLHRLDSSFMTLLIWSQN